MQMETVDRAVKIVNGVIEASARGAGGSGSVDGAADSLEELMRSELRTHEAVTAGSDSGTEAEVIGSRPPKIIRVTSRVSVYRKVKVRQRNIVRPVGHVHRATAACS
jgi:hypothetical protein